MGSLEEARIIVDPEWYLTTYPDVAAAIRKGTFKSAIQHYLSNGFREGRLPMAPDLDEPWYVRTYPDVAKAIREGRIRSAKQHFLDFGYKEGRSPRSVK
jgi:hypothetical protein